MEQALQRWKRDEGQPDFARPNECGNYRLSVTAREAECHPLEPSSTEKGGLAGFLGPWRAMPWRRQVGTVVHHLGAGAAILDPGRPAALLRHDAEFDRTRVQGKTERRTRREAGSSRFPLHDQNHSGGQRLILL